MFTNPWIEDYNNFLASLRNLRSLVSESNLDDVEKLIVVNFYKDCILQALNLLESYLAISRTNDFDSKNVIHKALLRGLIDDSEAWYDALESKDQVILTDDSTAIDDTFDRIRLSYYPVLLNLMNRMKEFV